jgi:feruloyl esterase
MRIGPLLAVVAVLAFGESGTAFRAAAAGPIACESLSQVPLANGTLISAESVPAGGLTPRAPANAAGAALFKTLPAFCRVIARLTPTPDSDIRIEVWLPLSGWNRKVQAAGNGGLGGTIPYPALAAAVRAGYAAAGRREEGRRSSRRNATRRISTASSPATRRGTRCASMPRGSP